MRSAIVVFALTATSALALGPPPATKAALYGQCGGYCAWGSHGQCGPGCECDGQTCTTTATPTPPLWCGMACDGGNACAVGCVCRPDYTCGYPPATPAPSTAAPPPTPAPPLTCGTCSDGCTAGCACIAQQCRGTPVTLAPPPPPGVCGTTCGDGGTCGGDCYCRAGRCVPFDVPVCGQRCATASDCGAACLCNGTACVERPATPVPTFDVCGFECDSDYDCGDGCTCYARSCRRPRTAPQHAMPVLHPRPSCRSLLDAVVDPLVSAALRSI